MCDIRILVTGTRGKSSLVRLIHAGLCAQGLKAYGRITGVIPRSLEPSCVKIIQRNSPVNFREMLWWLKSLPTDAQAIIMENSAVNPEFQPAAAKWLRPNLTVITNLRPDHQDAWGYSAKSVERAILAGVPKNAPVIFGETCGDFREENISLAVRALEFFGVKVAREVLENLSPDIADFKIIDGVACAFSANDVESTEILFSSTGWHPENVTLLYHHRPDRSARLDVFLKWINAKNWRDVFFTRTKKFFTLRYKNLRWLDSVNSPESFSAWKENHGGKIFACGNVAGWPLEFMTWKA